MPEIGEIRKAIDIEKHGTNTFIWHACVDCGKVRWVMLIKGKPVYFLCRHCSDIKKGLQYRGDKSSQWKEGRRYERGYIEVKLQPSDFFFPMAMKGGYVLEHRLVVAKALGRCLQPWEIVHHKNGIKDDNRYPENLQVISDLGHRQLTLLESKIDKLLEMQRELKTEIKLLRLENRRLQQRFLI